MAAEKGQSKIAVEIKSFIGPSEIYDLERALGQFTLYDGVMEDTEPGRVLYIAIHQEIYVNIFEEPIGKKLLAKQQIRLLVFDKDKEDVLRWIP